MTQVSQQDASSDAPWYRRESWLAVSMMAIVTMFGAVLGPQSWKVVLLVLTGLLMLIAVVMLIRQEKTVRPREQGKRSSA